MSSRLRCDAHRPRSSLAAAQLRRSRQLRPRAPARCVAAAAAADGSSAADDADVVAPLLAWCAARGAELHPGLTVAASAAGGRGLFATRALAAGTRVARIPAACCLTDEPCDSADAGAPWPVRMAAALLRAEAAGEAWAPFMAALPRQAVPLGAFAPWRVLKEAQMPHTLVRASDTAWLLQHDARHAACGGADDEDAWRWALSVALSRTCKPLGATRRGDDDTPLRLLAPLFDMANHTFDEPALLWAWEERDGGALVLHTAREAHAGEELCISYGDHASDTFWLHYGFVPTQGANACERTPLFESEAHAAHWLTHSEGAEDDGDDVGGGGFRADDDADAEEAEEARLCAGPGAQCTHVTHARSRMHLCDTVRACACDRSGGGWTVA
jgi:hypothetical protein